MSDRTRVICTPLQVANFFIKLSGEQGVGVNHLKLQKLTYCAHGWWLYVKNGEIFLDEKPEAWKHGPVFPSLYNILKLHGWNKITELQSALPLEDPPSIDETDANKNEICQALRWVWLRYLHLDGWDMSELTHRAGTPWFNLIEENGYPPATGLHISNDAIREEFRLIATTVTDS